MLVATSAQHGVHFAEFPTTTEAAAACRAHGIKVMMGGPNLIRGGSHSGNVAAKELAEAGLLDILSSDYVPSSLLSGALFLGERIPLLGYFGCALIFLAMLLVELVPELTKRRRAT